MFGDDGDGLTLRVETAPRHGRVQLITSADRNNGVRETNLSSAALTDLLDSDVRLVYRHDGSETTQDQFTLALTDGAEVTSRTCHVTVIPVNDARPVVTTSSVLTVAQGGSAVITSNNLLATDDDSDNDQVLQCV